MSALAPAPPTALTAGGFLFGGGDAVDGLARALADHGGLARTGVALGRLSSAASRAVCRRVAEVAVALTDIDVGDVVVAGWRKYAALANAAWRTLDNPGSEELVDLASHRITSVHHPELAVLVDDVPVGSVRFELRLDLVVRALVGIVREGRLTAVEAGRCRLSASLSCFDLTLAARETELDLGAVVNLGAGVPLVPAHVPAP
jgi:hypothetical protein